MNVLKAKKKMIFYKIVSGILSTIIGFIILTIVLVIFKSKLATYKDLIQLGYLALFAFLILGAFIEPIFNVLTYQYVINEHQVQFTRGLYKRTTVVIPMNRIQHLTMITGPIATVFNVGRVEVVTTNGNHQLDYITIEEGQLIVEQISKLLFKKAVVEHEADV